MQLNFKKWLEAIVPFSLKDDIAKHYSPGTFGIELEFQIHPNSKFLGRFEYERERDSKITKYIQLLASLGEKAVENTRADKNTWAVGEDAEALVEIRSRHLNITDIPLVVNLLKELKNESYHGGTSAHIHIGASKASDAFDLLAVMTLADESQILKQLSADKHPRTMKWTQLRDDFAENFADMLKHKNEEFSKKGEVILSNAELQSIIGNMSRNYGTNIQSFGLHGTVEFRYLSSQIIEAPEAFGEWIKYFLILPQIASKKTQIVLKDLILTRIGGGQTKVAVKKTGVKYPKPYENAWALKAPQEHWIAKYALQRFLAKYGEHTLGEFFVPLNMARNNNTLEFHKDMVNFAKALTKVYPDIFAQDKYSVLSDNINKLTPQDSPTLLRVFATKSINTIMDLIRSVYKIQKLKMSEIMSHMNANDAFEFANNYWKEEAGNRTVGQLK